MVSLNTVRNASGVLGNVITFMLFLSPMPTFIEIWKAKCVKQYSAAPYLAALISCMVLILYGLPIVHPGSLLVVTINGVGAAIELAYVVIFIAFSDNKTRLKLSLILVFEFIFVSILVAVVLSVAQTTHKRSLIVGCVSVCLSIIMYGSPLSVMETVITTKSVECMPLLLSFATFVNAAAWSVYAFIHFDVFLVIPNGIGILLALAQLILFCVFDKSTKRQTEARNAKDEEVGWKGEWQG